MSQIIKRKVRQFEKHNITILKKRFDAFEYLPAWKRLASVALEWMDKPASYSKRECIAALLQSSIYVEPATGEATHMGLVTFNNIVNRINKDKKKYPMLKMYSLPYEDQPNENGIAEVRYLLTIISDRKTALKAMKMIDKVVTGLVESKDSLDEVGSKGAKKIKKELKNISKKVEQI